MMMNSIRCSEAAIALVVLLVAVSGVAAQSVTPVDDGAPDAVKAGEDIEQLTYQIEDLFENTDADSWKLRVSTELKDASWRVQYLNQGGEVEQEETLEGSSATPDRQVRSDGRVGAIKVTVEGTVPEVGSYTYPKKETFNVMTLTRVGDGGLDEDMKTVDSHHYTRGSKTARKQLDRAKRAISAAEDRGAGVSEAKETFQSARDAYTDGNFDNARRLANRAEEQAQGSQESQQLLVYGVGAVVALLLIGGGIYLYRSRQDQYDELG